MAKHIIEYKLHGGHIPYFVEDGGYFAIGGKLIGLSKDSDKCHVPSAPELVHLTNQELIDRVVALSLNDIEGTPLTIEEKTTMANTWLSNRGLL